MQADSGVNLQLLKVDGGMTENSLMMQFQADLLDCAVLTPQTKETTALGAAFIAGLAVGFWKNFEELRCIWSVGKKWDPYMPAKRRETLLKGWKKAVIRSLGWEEADEDREPLPLLRRLSRRSSSTINYAGDKSTDMYFALQAACVIGSIGLAYFLGTKYK